MAGKKKVEIDILDWLGDTRKRMTSKGGMGAWLDLRIAMEKQGTYYVQGQVDAIVKMFGGGTTSTEGHAFLQELVTNKLFQIDFLTDDDKNLFWTKPNPDFDS